MKRIPYRQKFYRSLKRQVGAVIVTVCLCLLFLLGFMGIAMDFGHLFIVKTELQTAMDSCALAAAQELDGQPLSIERARNAGRTAGNMNGVDFQSGEWELEDQHITFRNANYIETADPLVARYVQCRFTQNGVRMWLMQAMGAAGGRTAAHPSTRSVLANAVATRGSALTSCPIPVALIQRNSTPPDYGYTVGEWIKVLDVNNNDNIYPQPGEMGWFNIDGSQGAQDTKQQLSAGGVCGTEVDDDVSLSTLGAKQGVAPYWNARFGLYRGGVVSKTVERPDFAGYGYDEENWPSKFNAWPDFVPRRAANMPHPGSGAWKPITAADHAELGYNRRIVTVPVLNSTNNKVADFVCMFMLEPMVHPTNPVYLEYRGNANVPGSPCTTNGMAGALAGPLVPVLVR